MVVRAQQDDERSAGGQAAMAALGGDASFAAAGAARNGWGKLVRRRVSSPRAARSGDGFAAAARATHRPAAKPRLRAVAVAADEVRKS